MYFKKKSFDTLSHDELIARQKRQFARLSKMAKLKALKNYNKDIKNPSFLNATKFVNNNIKLFIRGYTEPNYKSTI